ncbi:hypothetical protein Ddc_07791 [Ditylenchus destructor]|nr:hypothetical protein Ddc_07791 [Ditylenchus destructor]
MGWSVGRARRLLVGSTLPSLPTTIKCVCAMFSYDSLILEPAQPKCSYSPQSFSSTTAAAAIWGTSNDLLLTHASNPFSRIRQFQSADDESAI